MTGGDGAERGLGFGAGRADLPHFADWSEQKHPQRGSEAARQRPTSVPVAAGGSGRAPQQARSSCKSQSPPAPHRSLLLTDAAEIDQLIRRRLVPSRRVQVRRRVMSTVPSLQNGQVGIGIKIARNESGQHVITSVLPGGPAHDTGQICVGDVVMAVNGVNVTEGKTVDEVSSLIIGPPGGSVELRTCAQAEREANAGESNSPDSTYRDHAATDIVGIRALRRLPRGLFGSTADAGGGQSGFGNARQCGIGLKFSFGPEACVVTEVQSMSPADDSKRVHVGDQLLQVDGQLVSAKVAAEVQELVNGAHGSTVTLTLRSKFDGEQRSVTLHRKAPVSKVADAVSQGSLRSSPANYGANAGASMDQRQSPVSGPGHITPGPMSLSSASPDKEEESTGTHLSAQQAADILGWNSAHGPRDSTASPERTRQRPADAGNAPASADPMSPLHVSDHPAAVRGLGGLTETETLEALHSLMTQMLNVVEDQRLLHKRIDAQAGLIRELQQEQKQSCACAIS